MGTKYILRKENVFKNTYMIKWFDKGLVFPYKRKRKYIKRA